VKTARAELAGADAVVGVRVSTARQKIDGRFRGCVRVNGGGELDCNDAETDLFDTQSQSEQVTGASFIMKRASSSVTCADVRAMAFP
jgi:hypothetical protein